MRALLAAAVLALAACGGEEAERERTAGGTETSGPPAPTCVPASGASVGRTYFVCRDQGRPPGHGRFLVEEAGRRRALDVESPTTSPAGHWGWAAVSPDGKTLLAQWVAECEVPIAYFVPAAGGAPRPVVATDLESIALGWTADGLAEVALPRGVCARGSLRPGVYTISPAGGKPRYVRPIDPATDTVRG